MLDPEVLPGYTAVLWLACRTAAAPACPLRNPCKRHLHIGTSGMLGKKARTCGMTGQSIFAAAALAHTLHTERDRHGQLGRDGLGVLEGQGKGIIRKCRREGARQQVSRGKSRAGSTGVAGLGWWGDAAGRTKGDQAASGRWRLGDVEICHPLNSGRVRSAMPRRHAAGTAREGGCAADTAR